MIHGRNGYTKHKCRCDICVTANKVYRREYKLANGGDMNIRLDATPLIARLIRDGQMAHVTRGMYRSWIKNGISVYNADKFCIKVGYHPYMIFGADFYEGCSSELAG